MLITGLMANHALDILGIAYIVRFAVKATQRKPVLEWFW